jgi:signal transduction histidine kinase
VVLFVFENFAASQRRGLDLRFHLEETVAALEASRARAAESARAVTSLAAQVAHEVNNPLAVVKVNVRWLADAPHDEGPPTERAEVVADTVGAVDRIARIVTDLRQQAAQHAPETGRPGGGCPAAPVQGRAGPR